MSGPPSVTLQPVGDAWASLVRTPPSHPLTRETRAALGLPADRPVVMGGHQPGPWHPGILAKWFAVETLAARRGLAGAWVVVDQSPGAAIPYPARLDDALTRREIELAPRDRAPGGLPAATPAPPTDGASEPITSGLARYADLLRRHAGEPTLARQLHAATLDAIGRVGDAQRSNNSPPIASLFASDLHATPAFAHLVGAMRADGESCARTYNEAAAAHPGSGVRALAVGAAGVELPLWERVEGGPWRTVTGDRLADLPDDRIVLRGLPMTGLLRRHACDLFIHGTGGGSSETDDGYDRVTEAWLGAWLGARDLAPSVVATATLTLDLGADLPTPEEIAAARAEAHRAEHDPSLLGQADLGQKKRELAERMKKLPRGSEERAAIFQQMQALRAGASAEHAGALATLRERAERLEARGAEAAVAHDRTWPFVLHEPRALVALRSALEAALAREGRS